MCVCVCVCVCVNVLRLLPGDGHVVFVGRDDGHVRGVRAAASGAALLLEEGGVGVGRQRRAGVDGGEDLRREIAAIKQ